MINRPGFDQLLKELKQEALDFSKKYPDTIISYQLLGSPLMFSTARCTLQDDFIICCPKFGTDKISGLNDL